MQLRTTSTFLIVSALLWQPNAFASGNPVQLKWNELAPQVSGKVVDLTVPGGAKLRGEVVTIREDTMVLDVKRSSDQKAFPKGNAVVPRASISTLIVSNERGKWGRRTATTVGVVVGLAAGGYAAAKSNTSAGGAVTILAAITGAVIVGSYYIGRGLDSKKTEIRIVP